MMNRRAFLASSAAFAATPLFGQDAPKIRKAVNLGMVREGATLEEKFKAAKEAGFDGFEIDAPNKLDRDALLKARDATGLRIHGVVCSSHWSSPLSDANPEVRAKGLKGLEAAIDDAKAYGAETVLLVPAVVTKAVSYADAWTRSVEEIRKAIPKAEESKILIAIENVWNQFLQSPIEFAKYVDDFKSTAVCAYFDVGNIVTYGWPEQWVRILGKRIRRLHIKEYSRKKRDAEGLWKGFNVELLEGDCDWPAVMKAVREIGFEDWATAEIPGGDAKRLKEIADRMDRILKG